MSAKGSAQVLMAPTPLNSIPLDPVAVQPGAPAAHIGARQAPALQEQGGGGGRGGPGAAGDGAGGAAVCVARGDVSVGWLIRGAFFLIVGCCC